MLLVGFKIKFIFPVLEATSPTSMCWPVWFLIPFSVLQTTTTTSSLNPHMDFSPCIHVADITFSYCKYTDPNGVGPMLIVLFNLNSITEGFTQKKVIRKIMSQYLNLEIEENNLILRAWISGITILLNYIVRPRGQQGWHLAVNLQETESGSYLNINIWTAKWS